MEKENLLPRSPSVQEFDSVVRFLNEKLRPEQTWSIAEEYPAVFKASNNSNLRIITDGQKVLSHAAIRTLVVRTPVTLFKVATIGSVVTDEQHRHQGLGTQLIEDCLLAAHYQACDLSVLWTDQYDFYRRMGFELAGTELTFELTDRFVPPPRPAGLRFEFSSRVSAESILRLYHQHTVNSSRTLQEVESYLKIPNSTVATCWSQDNKLLAFAVEGKGLDLSCYVHEWGGQSTPLLHLLDQLRLHKKSDLRVLVPQHSQNLVAKLQDGGAHKYPGYLGMIRIMNPDNFWRKLKRSSRLKAIAGWELLVEQDSLRLQTRENTYEFRDRAALTQLIFGPTDPGTLAAFNGEELALLRDVFPLPFWIWGWDSI